MRIHPLRTQLPLSLSYSYSYYLASLTRRGTPTQKNGNDGCLRWWKVVVLVVDGSHRTSYWFLCFALIFALLGVALVSFSFGLWTLDAPFFVIAF